MQLDALDEALCFCMSVFIEGISSVVEGSFISVVDLFSSKHFLRIPIGVNSSATIVSAELTSPVIFACVMT